MHMDLLTITNSNTMWPDLETPTMNEKKGNKSRFAIEKKFFFFHFISLNIAIFIGSPDIHF